MIAPVKSISQLSSFPYQKGSIEPFEQFTFDDNIIGVNRYSLSGDSIDYNHIYAGLLQDDTLYIEVSYKDPVTKKYVPRKFDFSNYLRYIENALSILNNGIIGKYLTEKEANELYVKKSGDRMFGPLSIDIDSNSKLGGFPFSVVDSRIADPYAGIINISGNKNAELWILNNDDPDAPIKLKRSTSTSTSSKEVEVKILNTLSAYSDRINLSHVKIENGILTANSGIETNGPSTFNGDITQSAAAETHYKITAGNSGIESNGTLTIANGGANITGGLTIASGGADITGDSTFNGNITQSTEDETAYGITTGNNGLTSNGQVTINSGGLLVKDDSVSIFNLTSDGLDTTVPISAFNNVTLSGSGNIVKVENDGILLKNARGGIYFTDSTTALTPRSGGTGPLYTLPSISYSTTLTAFVITNLQVPTSLIVGTSGMTVTNRDAITTSDWIPPNSVDVPTCLTIHSNVLCNGSFKGQQAIVGKKLVTDDFDANIITANDHFSQPNGIAELTAKQACWA